MSLDVQNKVLWDYLMHQQIADSDYADNTCLLSSLDRKDMNRLVDKAEMARLRINIEKTKEMRLEIIGREETYIN